MRAFLVLLAVLSCIQATAQQTACSIEGNVKNLFTSAPVRKAKVSVALNNVPKYEAITDTNGHFAIGGIAPGRYRLFVQRPNYLPVQYGARGPNRTGKSLTLTAGEIRHDIDFLLEPPAAITGHVYDQDGEPLMTSVQLFREVWLNGRRSFQAAGGANADDEGEYRLFGLAAGSYIVGTMATGVRPASPVPTHEIYAQTFYPGTEDANSASLLKLAPGSEARNIDLRVRKTNSVMVSGHWIGTRDTTLRLTLQRADGFPIQSLPIMFPQPGEFMAKNVTPGSYVLIGRSQSEYGRMNLDVGTLDVGEIDLHLSPLLEVTGKLKVEGDPPEDLPAVTLTSTEPGVASIVARPDDKGALDWRGLVPGAWHVDLNKHSTYLKSPAEIQIGPEGHPPLEIVISTRGAAVSGVVHASTEIPDPIEASTVLVIQNGRVVANVSTDPDGRFNIPNIPPGKVRLVALEDVETFAWENPELLQKLNGQGVSLDLTASEVATKDLFLIQP